MSINVCSVLFCSVKLFSKLYYRHSEWIVKNNICLMILLQQGISEPVLYGDLVYNLKELLEGLILVINLKRLIILNVIKRVGYNMDILRQSACFVVNPITVFSYDILFHCTTTGQASDSMTALT